MDDCLLGIRRDEITDLRAVVGHTEAVDPCLPNGFTRPIVIGIALEVVHEKEGTRREDPEGAFGRITLIIDFIHAPVVSGVGLKQAGIIILIADRLGSFILRRAGIRITNGRFVRTEVELVRGGGIGRRPA